MSTRIPFTIYKSIKGAPTPPVLISKLITNFPTYVVEAGTAAASAIASGVLTQSPAAVRDPDLDITFDCEGYDNDGNPRQGIPIATAYAYGSKPFIDFIATVTAAATASGTHIFGNVFYATSTATAIANAYGDLVLQESKRNWIKWANIGEADFTIWKDNIAGEEPLDWKGWVYIVKKLGNRAIAYGENGVTALIPNANVFTPQTVYRIGVKGKQAIAGSDAVHFFIDTDGQLFMFGETVAKASLFESASYPQNLGYEEYLSVMTNPVLSWDELNNLLYICDGTYGYVYSPFDKSLGKGPINVTGISSQGGTLYVVSPATIVTPPFVKWTDIYDMGSRKGKHISSVEYGTNVTQTMEASIKYRLDKAGSFYQSPWCTVDKRGTAFIHASGREFQFGAKVDTYEQFEIDWIKVNGVLYDM